MTFRVGQRVVCVDDDFPEEYFYGDGTPNLPYSGGVYTVRDLCMWSFNGDTHPGIYLEEVVNPERRWIRPIAIAEHPFWAGRFRPVKETDISIFTAMLAPTPKQKQRVTTER
jgi:hypothetical protein